MYVYYASYIHFVYSTAHIQVYKKHMQCFVPWEILKVANVLGLCDMRNTLLMSDYWWVENTCEQLLSCNFVLTSNILSAIRDDVLAPLFKLLVV